MKIPDSIEVQECSGYYTWMEDDGICRTKVKENQIITIREAMENSEIVKRYDEGKKYPLIVDARGIKFMTREAREYLSIKDRPSPVCAIAIIVGSPLSIVIGNFFIGLNKSSVPNKLFSTYPKALKWALKHKI